MDGGSSPLTRGKPAPTRKRKASRGLIPAHAGKTHQPEVRPWGTTAHPRSRGENDVVEEFLKQRPGSSPLTRGKPSRGVGYCGTGGLIPAHAGKTARAAFPAATSRAHPRSRGENSSRSGPGAIGPGSSPLTRGKLQSIRPRSHRPGLIPAHAGKTPGNRLPIRAEEAHPRSRGENGAVAVGPIFPHGSSPLTRGKPHTRRTTSRVAGLIPAHAGKTDRGEAFGPRVGAHPRSRGENTRRAPTVSSAAGSSPLTRGKLRQRLERELWRGLIPAHAGKTAPSTGKPNSPWAHPRSRGENNVRTDLRVGPEGSSPLTRGKQGDWSGLQRRVGLIPAHAGKTAKALSAAPTAGAHPRSRGENPCS